jgi:hypothetical protein
LVFQSLPAKNKVHNPLSLSLGPQSKAHKNRKHTDRGAHTQHPIHPVLVQKKRKGKKTRRRRRRRRIYLERKDREGELKLI